MEPGMARNCERLALRTSPPMKLDVMAYSVMKSGHTIAYIVCFQSNDDCCRFFDATVTAAVACWCPLTPATYELKPLAVSEWLVNAITIRPAITPTMAIPKHTSCTRK